MAEAQRTVHARARYVPDKEVHVCEVQTDQDGVYVDVREFIPSLNTYGRGILFPIDLLDTVEMGLRAIRQARDGDTDG